MTQWAMRSKKFDNLFEPNGEFAIAIRQIFDIPQKAFLAVLETGEEEGKRK
jgi:hypothetical protein